MLGAIMEDVGDTTNVASGIVIAGYTKTKKGQKRPRLSFTPTMMQMIFDSPLYTGCSGPSDIQRTRPGNVIYQDELYWAFLFGVMSGPRLEEIGQIALGDVHHCDLGQTFGADYQGRCTYVHVTGTGEQQIVKNDESDRYIVIHDRLIDLVFSKYVERRRLAGNARLSISRRTRKASSRKY